MLERFDIDKTIASLWIKIDSWIDSLILNLPNFLLASLVFVLFIFLAKYSGKILNKILIRSLAQASIRNITVKVTKGIVVLVGFFIALGLLNLDKVLTTVLASAGVVGLAVGLALQGTLNNSFSGVILSFMPNLQLGDWIKTKDYEGEVIDINLRNIVIKEADNNYVMIPNSTIVQSPFKNFSFTPRSRVTIKVGVSYKSDLEFVQELTVQTLDQIFKQQKNEEIEFFYQEFADSSINFVVRFWCNVRRRKDILQAQNKAIIAIKKAFDANNVNIPFPIRTIDFSNNLSVEKEFD